MVYDPSRINYMRQMFDMQQRGYQDAGVGGRPQPGSRESSLMRRIANARRLGRRQQPRWGAPQPGVARPRPQLPTVQHGGPTPTARNNRGVFGNPITPTAMNNRGNFEGSFAHGNMQANQNQQMVNSYQKFLQNGGKQPSSSERLSVPSTPKPKNRRGQAFGGAFQSMNKNVGAEKGWANSMQQGFKNTSDSISMPQQSAKGGAGQPVMVGGTVGDGRYKKQGI